MRTSKVKLELAKLYANHLAKSRIKWATVARLIKQVEETGKTSAIKKFVRSDDFQDAMAALIKTRFNQKFYTDVYDDTLLGMIDKLGAEKALRKLARIIENHEIKVSRPINENHFRVAAFMETYGY